jgi:hypothetical protein
VRDGGSGGWQAGTGRISTLEACGLLLTEAAPFFSNERVRSDELVRSDEQVHSDVAERGQCGSVAVGRILVY